MKELLIEAKVQELPKLAKMLDEELEAAGFNLKQIAQFQLAAEEIFVNIANYAYGDAEGKADICFEILPNPTRAVITFKDQGIPYNPLEKQDPDVTLPLDDRSIGGLGIYLTKKVMDNVIYSFEDGCNILTLEKNM